ncbi:unnamed protein product [Dibothriocephalus latus]|uniref:G-protein coupled receptors family 1 profile domain-containing protein n=1 Tax=Dibothriocephalus latus TaxID=60516 RepID=A0A3P7NK54_DIBLA|nr:unnamed protein product [Dibothriocephalus latus]
MGILWMGRSVLTMLRTWIAVWIGFQRCLLTVRPSTTRCCNVGLRRPGCRVFSIFTITVLLFNLPGLLNRILLKCNREDSRLLLLHKVHALVSNFVIYVLPLCLLGFFSQRIYVRTHKLIDLYRHRPPPMPGTVTRIRLFCLHMTKLLLVFMFTYVVLAVPALFQMIYYLLKMLRREDWRLVRLPRGVKITSSVCWCAISTLDLMIFCLFWPPFRRRAIDCVRGCCPIFVQNT